MIPADLLRLRTFVGYAFLDVSTQSIERIVHSCLREVLQLSFSMPRIEAVDLQGS